MSMTDEEREELELECANAKSRCREAWQVLLALEKITKTYFKIHDHWRKRFEAADYKLALEFRMSHEKVKKQSKNPLSGLSKEQLKAIALELMEEEGGE